MGHAPCIDTDSHGKDSLPQVKLGHAPGSDSHGKDSLPQVKVGHAPGPDSHGA